MAKKARGVKHIKNDVYLIDYQVGLERRQERIHAATIKAAREEREKRKVELREERKDSSNGQRHDATFEDAWVKLEADLLSDKVSTKNVQRHKRIYHGMFFEFLPMRFSELKSPSQLTLPFLLEYKNHFVNELKRDANGGWRAELICIKSMIRRLKKLGFCSKNIVEELLELRRPNSEKKEYPDIPKNELKKLFDFMKQERLQYFYVFKFALITGRRINEITSIEKKDVEWHGLMPIRINIRGEITKMKKDAPITRLSDELKQIIIKASQRNPQSKYVFSGSESSRCKPDRLREYLKRISKNILGVALTPHYFRHRFMTECGKARVPFADVSNISGIRDIEVMQRHYAHSTESGQDSVFAVTTL